MPDVVRLWNISRQISRRLNEPLAAFLPDINAQPDSLQLPVKNLLSLGAACDIVLATTDRIATYPPTTPDPLHQLILQWRQEADHQDTSTHEAHTTAKVDQLRRCASDLADLIGEPHPHPSSPFTQADPT
jgi:hypothetical protein